MNRPIKFRAWSAGDMWTWEQLKQAPTWFWCEAERLMQFTGFVDKNGVEIYEGDLILLDEEWAEHIGSGRTLCMVGFEGGAFMFGRSDVAPRHMNTHLWATVELRKCAVVGNIFQTPAWDSIPPEQSRPS